MSKLTINTSIILIAMIAMLIISNYLPFTASAAIIKTNVTVQATFTENDTNYASVIESNNETWVIEVDLDCTVNQKLIMWYNDNNTSLYDDDITIFTMSELLYNIWITGGLK